MLIFGISSFLCASEHNYGGNFTTALADIGDVEKTSMYVTNITFSCDIPLSKYEFFYLTGLRQHTYLGKKNIDDAYKRLMLKKRFEHINVDVANDGLHKKIHFTLVANWIFKKIEFEGIWFGKQRYADLYLQQPGDVFDINLHEESLKILKKHLYDQGYFSCQISDEIVYAKKQKILSVRIKINKKKRFSVKNMDIVCRDITAQTIPKNEILSILRTILVKFRSDLHKSFYSKKLLQKNIKKIKSFLKKNYFINARLELRGDLDTACHTVSLKLGIYLGSRKIITLEGNELFSDEQIKNEFIGVESPDWIFSPEIIAQQLLHEYYKKGYWHARITSKLRNDGGYHFIIQEGASTIIEQISVVDVATHEPEKSGTVLNRTLQGKKCDQALLDKSLEYLHGYYQSCGFWDFKVVAKEFIKNQKTGNYTVKLSIDKGVKRVWAGFHIDGFRSLESNEFFKKYKSLSASGNVPFNINWLQNQRLFLLSYFQEEGFWYVDVEPQLIIIPPKKPITESSGSLMNIFVNWKIVPGPLVTFGKTILRGSTTVDFKKIKKQCAFTESSLWNTESLDRTRNKLRRLDVFRMVQVQPYHLAKNKGKKPVIITLVDDDPVELRARLGYFLNSSNVLFKQQSTPKVGASFIIKNPTNRADRMAVVGDWTRFERKFALDYQQPSPFGVAALGTFKGFANKYVHPVEFKNSGSAYQALEYGVLAGLSEQYEEDCCWSVNIGNEVLKITQVRGNLKFDKNLINTPLPYLFVEPSLQIDKLDSRIHTTKGSLTNVSVKMMVPENNGDVSAKLFVDQSVFYPVYKKCILAGRIRFGHIFRRKFEKVLPNERFYLGGPESVRGYEPDALPPLGESIVIQDGKLVKQFTIQGGSSMVNANLELRFPLYKSFGAVLFQDIGILSQSGLGGFKDRWYPGVGFGLRYKTPIGSIRFDIGWKGKRRIKEDTKSYAWYLTLGEAF